MSWNVTIVADMSTDISKAIDEAFDENARERGGPQLEYAKEAALSLLTGVARPQDRVRISLTGHYNEGCEPTAGWSNCFISLSVSQDIV